MVHYIIITTITAALSSVENVEPETDERRFHKETFVFLLNDQQPHIILTTIANRLPIVVRMI